MGDGQAEQVHIMPLPWRARFLSKTELQLTVSGERHNRIRTRDSSLYDRRQCD